MEKHICGCESSSGPGQYLAAGLAGGVLGDSSQLLLYPRIGVGGTLSSGGTTYLSRALAGLNIRTSRLWAPTLSAAGCPRTRLRSAVALRECGTILDFSGLPDGKSGGTALHIMQIELQRCPDATARLPSALARHTIPQSALLQGSDHVALIAAGMATHKNLAVRNPDRKTRFAVVMGRASRHPALPDFPGIEPSGDALSGHAHPQAACRHPASDAHRRSPLRGADVAIGLCRFRAWHHQVA